MSKEFFTGLLNNFQTNIEIRSAKKVIESSDSVVMIGRRNDCSMGKVLGLVGFDGTESDLYFSSLCRNVSFFESIVVMGVNRERLVEGIVKVKNRGKIYELTEGVL